MFTLEGLIKCVFKCVLMPRVISHKGSFLGLLVVHGIRINNKYLIQLQIFERVLHCLNNIDLSLTLFLILLQLPEEDKKRRRIERRLCNVIVDC